MSDRGVKRIQEGTVVKKSGDKTLSVLVRHRKKHPFYNKIIKVSKKYLVHDEFNVGEAGKQVRIMESRPYSRRKRWRLVAEEKGDAGAGAQ